MMSTALHVSPIKNVACEKLFEGNADCERAVDAPLIFKRMDGVAAVAACGRSASFRFTAWLVVSAHQAGKFPVRRVT
jgi:hypothetical protein